MMWYSDPFTWHHSLHTLSQTKHGKKLSLHKNQGAHQVGAYIRFMQHEANRSITIPPWMGW